jgi:hypothetical protein
MVLVNFSESAILLLPPILKYYLSFLVSNTDPDIACHHGGNEGTSAVGTAPSGSQVSFEWTYVRFYSLTVFWSLIQLGIDI